MCFSKFGEKAVGVSDFKTEKAKIKNAIITGNWHQRTEVYREKSINRIYGLYFWEPVPDCAEISAQVILDYSRECIQYAKLPIKVKASYPLLQAK